MANEEHLTQLKRGLKLGMRAWDEWRKDNPDIRPDLRKLRLVRAFLRGANLCDADLHGAYLPKANLLDAKLCWQPRRGAPLGREPPRGEPHRGGSLAGLPARTSLGQTSPGQICVGQCLREPSQCRPTSRGRITGCAIYGISAWGVELTGAQQANLLIMPANEPQITVDDLEVAQFIYLLIHNEKIRGVIDTIGKKGVLILGRFAGERKDVLEALRTALRSRGFLPMVFDFEKPTQRDFTETIMTLAGMSLFVIADITNPRSAPLELQATVPDYTSLSCRLLPRASRRLRCSSTCSANSTGCSMSLSMTRSITSWRGCRTP